MAIPKIKATYALDPATVSALERMARRWKVSKSEALRRAIRAAADAAAAEEGPLAPLDRLQRSMALGPAAARRWSRSVRSERKTGSERRRAGGR